MKKRLIALIAALHTLSLTAAEKTNITIIP